MRTILATAIIALLLIPSLGVAVIFDDPTDTGTQMGITPIPADTAVVLHIYWHEGSTPSLGANKCVNGIGHESCGGDVTVEATGDVIIQGGSAPAGGDTILNHIDAKFLKANWLNPFTPDTAPLPVVDVTVFSPSAGAGGGVVVYGMNVKADLTELVIASTQIASTAGAVDSDGDGVDDLADNCPFVPNGAGEATGSPTWGNQAESGQFPGTGCACLCGDPNRDCAVNVSDAAEAQRAGTVPPLSPLSPNFDVAFCDINSDGACNVADSPEMQRVGLVPPLPPASPPSFSVTACSGYGGP